MNISKKIEQTKFNPMQKELVRKSLHMSVALFPVIYSLSSTIALTLLVSGSLFYLISEIFRMNNVKIFSLVSTISEVASRERDKGITLGPLAMALGVLFSVLIFNPMAATCGVFALAFGDGLSSITGKLWGVKKIPFTGGKSFIGSFTCFTMILSTSYGVTGSLKKSIFAAVGGTLVELIPVKDLDNILIPISVSILITLL